MELLNRLKTFASAEKFVQTANYYFENHICEKSGKAIKVRLDYTLSNDITDDIIRLGMCEECKTCFYHKDFQSGKL
jgi:hypothetical protein